MKAPPGSQGKGAGAAPGSAAASLRFSTGCGPSAVPGSCRGKSRLDPGVTPRYSSVHEAVEEQPK